MNPHAGVRTRPLAVVVIIAGLVIGVVLWWGSGGGHARRPSDSTVECQQRYAQATSFEDTAAVDLSYPTVYWQQVSGRRGVRACGDLRRELRLPR
jgi:hypothetical protein